MRKGRKWAQTMFGMLAAVTMLGSMHVAAAAEETILPADEPEQLVERQDAEQQETESGEEALLGLTTQCTTYSGSNKNAQNYSRWSEPIKSALAAAPSGELMRVQAGAIDGKYLVEYYDSAYDYKRNLQIDEELPIFGGFYTDGSYYYILSGQSNKEEDNSVEVFRVTKYSTSWQRLGAASLKGANTVGPLDAGARFAHEGNNLFIRTSHTMYKYKDGINHQANVQMQINTQSMTMVDSSYVISNSGEGYVSHSFNQFVQVDNGKIVGLDHGDANPRAVALLKYNNAYTASGFNKRTSCIELLSISGEHGDNDTGVSVGGFELTGSNYMAVGNSVEMGSNYSSSAVRNIFTAVVDKNLQGSPVVTQITSYGEGETSPSTPQLVKVNDDTFFLLWTKGDKLCYCKINGSGQAVSGIYEKEGALSDCVPIVKDGKCIWYVWEQEDVTFYEIPVGDPAALKVSEINNGHQYTITYADADSNVASRTCKVCGYSESFTTPDSLRIYGAKNGGTRYSSRISGTYAIGDTLTFWAIVDGSPDNSEITIESSNPSVAKITGEDATFLSCGTAEVKIYPTYRPSLVSTYTLNVPHSYGEGVITRSGNCAEEQITSYTCTVCGDVKTEKGSKDPSVHTGGTQVKNAKEATCGAEGYSGDTYCKSCNTKLSSGKAVPATGKHSGGTATCKEAAVCSVCGQSYGNRNASNHVGGTQVKNAKAATCGAEGYSGDTYCKSCNVKVASGSAVPATGKHTGGTATCKEAAVCSVCGQSYGNRNASNHVGGTQVKNAKEATCGAEGYSGDTYCRSCNAKTASGSAVPATGKHTGGTATCKAAAVCSVCGQSYGNRNASNHVGGTQVKNAKEATCGAEGYTGDTYCTSCNAKTASGNTIPATGKHTGGTATCKAAAVCSVCGQSYGNKNASKHVGGTQVKNAKEATCGADGYTGDAHCKGCDAKLSPGSVIPATGKHTGGTATCKEAAVCSVCGQNYGSKDASNHVAETILKNRKEATCMDEGYTGDTYCSGCDALLENGDVIPATGVHSGGRADCGNAAVCVNCGQSYGETDPSNHVGEREIRNDKAAGKEDGYSGDIYCGTCGALLENGQVIPAVQAEVETAPMYRLYNPNSGEHFYTASSGEKNYLVKVGWNYEGIGWNAPVKSNTPVYRLYNPVAGDHHYTTSAGERDFLVAAGWNYENICWYSDDARSMPLYRQYNPNAVTGTHNYTTSAGERDFLVRVGWQEEGIGWYGVK
ncbi:MAG: hypothetical protein Q4B22_11310 [Eubacteriales bacterium]|nr:hypothetical protein [Eubacteriales bacterium]